VIVVAGGSGRLGRLVVADLVGGGERVRVVVTDADRAAAVLGPAVEVVAADVRRPDGLAEAVAGAAVVVSAVHGFLGGRGAGPSEVDGTGNRHLLAATGAAGAAFVLVSVLGASPTSALDLDRAKHTAEADLQRGSTPWTVVRAAPFLETWVEILRATAARSGRAVVLGRGEQPIPFASAADVAAVVTRAVLDDSLRGRVLEVAGERRTLNALAAAVQLADHPDGGNSGEGRDGRPQPARHVPRPVLRALAVLARPISPSFARQNRAALVLDTTDLGAADTAVLDLLGLPAARGLAEVLGRPVGAPAWSGAGRAG